MPPASTRASARIVPATLALTLGTAELRRAHARRQPDYTAEPPGTVTSTAGDATLTVHDPSATAPGHLVNGSYALAAAAAGRRQAVGGLEQPTALQSWASPVSNDPLTLALKQSVGANDGCAPAATRKTLTFTLSTTAP